MLNTYMMSNMAPQHCAFNRGTWLILEELVRHWAEEKKTIYVITGAVFDRDGQPGRDPDGDALRVQSDNGKTRVAVPSRFYKILLHKPRNQPLQALGILLPHVPDKIPSGRDAQREYLKRHIVSIDDIEKVVIETQEAGVRIIDKTGPLDNPADRDHCIQYMVAVPLIFGRLTAADYEDDVASDPRIDALRDKMVVTENEQYTKDYFDPDKRYIGNAVQVFFKDGSSTDKIAVDFPIGHRERRAEGIPVLKQKFVDSVQPKLAEGQWAQLEELCADRGKLAATTVDDFMALLVA